LSPVIITGLDAHAAQFGEALLDAALDDVLELDHAQHLRAVVATTSGVLPRRATSSTCARTVRRESCRRASTCADGVGRALADLAAIDIDAAHARLRGEGHEHRAERRDVALAQVEALLGQHHDAAALGRLVGQRGELRGVGQLALGHAGAGRKAAAWRLPSVMVPVLSSSSTSTSPAASTARPEVAITLACIMRLMPAMPMADSRPPMVVGIRQTSSATSTVIVTGSPCPAAAR
jgi:hypothetical protein